MKRNKYLLIAITVACICLAAAAISAAIPNNAKKYEVDAVVDVPEYKTDTARAIDAYERLMERYMDLSEKIMSGDSQNVSAKLDLIDGKLTELSARLARIEKALGIDPNGNLTGKTTKSSDTK